MEEQFYLLVPFLLWAASRGRYVSIRWVLWLSVLSLALTDLTVDPSFYLLDSRFWELGVGVTIAKLALSGPALLQGGAPRGAHARVRDGYIAAALLLVLAAGVSCGLKQGPWSRDKALAIAGSVVLFASATAVAQLLSSYRRPAAWARLLELWVRHQRTLRAIIGVAGFALLSVSLLALRPLDWPGPQTLLPVLGSALLIVSGPAAPINRLLACRLLVFIGGISYPLYLWHWPAIVFWRMQNPDRSLFGYLIPVATAFFLAWATKQSIENPVRFGTLGALRVRPPPIWAVSAGLVITGLLGASAVALDGYPARVPPALRAIASWSVPNQDAPWRGSECYFYPTKWHPFAPQCTPPKQPGVPRLLLWGDSHAAELYPGVAGLRQKHDFDIIQWTAAGCPPTRLLLEPKSELCARRRAYVLRAVLQERPDAVLLAGAWELYLEHGSSEQEILAATLDDMHWLHSIGIQQIVLFGPSPTWQASLPVDLFHYMSVRRTLKIPERLGGVSSAVWHLDAAMAAQAAMMHARYVSILGRFCDRRGCRTLGDPGRTPPDLLFRDRDHLTVSGSQFLAQAAAPQILAAAQGATVEQPHR